MKDFRNLEPVDYLKIIWRRRWYVLACFMLISIGSGIYGWRMPDIFKSESIVVVESALISQDYVRSSELSSPEERIAGIQGVLQSRSFLERMVQEFQLYGYGTGNPFSMDDAVASLRNSITVGRISQNMFAITSSSANPQSAQMLTQRVVQTLIDTGNLSRRNKALEADQFFDEQLRETEQDLQVQEEKIKQFKIAHLGELPEQSTANANALIGLNSQLSAVENALQNARDRQKMLEISAQEQNELGAANNDFLSSWDLLSALGSDMDNSPTSINSNPLLREREADLAALKLKYTSNHPDVIRVSRQVEELKRQEAEASAALENSNPKPLDATEEEPESTQAEYSALLVEPLMGSETAQIGMEADSIKDEIARYEKERDNLQGQIKMYQNRLNMAPALEQEFMALSREHDALRQQYASLKNKKFQTQMTANLETDADYDTYRVIDEANYPEKPAFPDRREIILMGLGAGLVIGIGAAFGRELLDTTLGSEDEVAAVLKLPVLAIVSEIDKKQLKRLKSA